MIIKIGYYGLLPEECNNIIKSIQIKNDHLDNIIEAADVIEDIVIAHFRFI